MAKNKIHKILASPDKGITKTIGVNGVLARLFRTLLLNMNITDSRWGSLMYDFISDVRNGVPNNRRDQTSMRGNLTKEFSRDEMTWKVFFKGLRFFKALKFDIVIKVYFENGKTTLAMTTVELGSRNSHDLAKFLDDVESPDTFPDDDDDHSFDDVKLESEIQAAKVQPKKKTSNVGAK